MSPAAELTPAMALATATDGALVAPQLQPTAATTASFAALMAQVCAKPGATGTSPVELLVAGGQSVPQTQAPEVPAEALAVTRTEPAVAPPDSHVAAPLALTQTALAPSSGRPTTLEPGPGASNLGGAGPESSSTAPGTRSDATSGPVPLVGLVGPVGLVELTAEAISLLRVSTPADSCPSGIDPQSSLAAPANSSPVDPKPKTRRKALRRSHVPAHRRLTPEPAPKAALASTTGDSPAPSLLPLASAADTTGSAQGLIGSASQVRAVLGEPAPPAQAINPNPLPADPNNPTNLPLAPDAGIVAGWPVINPRLPAVTAIAPLPPTAAAPSDAVDLGPGPLTRRPTGLSAIPPEPRATPAIPAARLTQAGGDRLLGTMSPQVPMVEPTRLAAATPQIASVTRTSTAAALAPAVSDESMPALPIRAPAASEVNDPPQLSPVNTTLPLLSAAPGNEPKAVPRHDPQNAQARVTGNPGKSQAPVVQRTEFINQSAALPSRPAAIEVGANQRSDEVKPAAPLTSTAPANAVRTSPGPQLARMAVLPTGASPVREVGEATQATLIDTAAPLLSATSANLASTSQEPQPTKAAVPTLGPSPAHEVMEPAPTILIDRVAPLLSAAPANVASTSQGPQPTKVAVPTLGPSPAHEVMEAAPTISIDRVAPLLSATPANVVRASQESQPTKIAVPTLGSSPAREVMEPAPTIPIDRVAPLLSATPANVARASQEPPPNKAAGPSLGSSPAREVIEVAPTISIDRVAPLLSATPANVVRASQEPQPTKVAVPTLGPSPAREFMEPAPTISIDRVAPLLSATPANVARASKEPQPTKVATPTLGPSPAPEVMEAAAPASIDTTAPLLSATPVNVASASQEPQPTKVAVPTRGPLPAREVKEAAAPTSIDTAAPLLSATPANVARASQEPQPTKVATPTLGPLPAREVKEAEPPTSIHTAVPLSSTAPASVARTSQEPPPTKLAVPTRGPSPASEVKEAEPPTSIDTSAPLSIAAPANVARTSQEPQPTKITVPPAAASPAREVGEVEKLTPIPPVNEPRTAPVFAPSDTEARPGKVSPANVLVASPPRDLNGGAVPRLPAAPAGMVRDSEGHAVAQMETASPSALPVSAEQRGPIDATVPVASALPVDEPAFVPGGGLANAAVGSSIRSPAHASIVPPPQGATNSEASAVVTPVADDANLERPAGSINAAPPPINLPLRVDLVVAQQHGAIDAEPVAVGSALASKAKSTEQVQPPRDALPSFASASANRAAVVDEHSLALPERSSISAAPSNAPTEAADTDHLNSVNVAARVHVPATIALAANQPPVVHRNVSASAVALRQYSPEIQELPPSAFDGDVPPNAEAAPALISARQIQYEPLTPSVTTRVAPEPMPARTTAAASAEDLRSTASLEHTAEGAAIGGRVQQVAAESAPPSDTSALLDPAPKTPARAKAPDNGPAPSDPAPAAGVVIESLHQDSHVRIAPAAVAGPVEATFSRSATAGHGETGPAPLPTEAPPAQLDRVASAPVPAKPEVAAEGRHRSHEPALASAAEPLRATPETAAPKSVAANSPLPARADTLSGGDTTSTSWPRSSPGTPVAQSPELVKTPAKLDKVASAAEQELPVAATSLSVAGSDRAKSDSGNPNAGADSRHAALVIPAPGLAPVQLEPRLDRWVEAPTVDAAAGARSPADQLLLHLHQHAVELKQLKLDSMTVVLKPDAQTEMSLHLRLQDGWVQAEARGDRGDFRSLQAQWGQMQASLAHQGIRLGPLRETTHTESTATGHQQSFDQPDRESPFRRRQFAEARTFEKPNYVGAVTERLPRRASPARVQRRAWESWA